MDRTQRSKTAKPSWRMNLEGDYAIRYGRSCSAIEVEEIEAIDESINASSDLLESEEVIILNFYIKFIPRYLIYQCRQNWRNPSK